MPVIFTFMLLPNWNFQGLRFSSLSYTLYWEVDFGLQFLAVLIEEVKPEVVKIYMEPYTYLSAQGKAN